MTNSTNITKSQFQDNLRKFVGVDSNNSSLALDKQENSLYVGTVTKFFLCEDMAEVKLRDKNISWKCYLPHLAISSDANISYSPDGEYKTDSNNNDYLKPAKTYNCIVYAINNDYNTYGAVILSYININHSDTPFVSGEGGFKVQVGTDSDNTRFKVRSNEFTIKDESGEILSLHDGKFNYYEKEYLKYELVETVNSNIKVYTDNVNIYIKFTGTLELTGESTTIGTLKDYKPLTFKRFLVNDTNLDTINIYETGEIKYFRTNSTDTSIELNNSITYPKEV